MNTYFISAIDTGVGKTIATGLLAQYLMAKKTTVMTMKIAQTGCIERSEDIEKHRELMGIGWQAIDENHTTCPYLFPYPASPHLAANIAGEKIDMAHIETQLSLLQKAYQYVLLEGVGGLMVPMHNELLLIDWLTTQKLPLILVSSGKLGSINHTLLSLAAIKNKQLSLYGLLYNHYPSDDGIIVNETKRYLKQYLKRHFPTAKWGEVTQLDHHKKNNLLLESQWF